MELIKTSTLSRAYLKAYAYVMWKHRIVETEDNELTYESGPLTVVASYPNEDKERLKLVSPYEDNFMRSYEDQLINGTTSEFDYTYNERLFNYQEVVNQVESMIDKISKEPYTRRAVATTWYPYHDNFENNSVPCLQYVQCKFMNGYLNMVTLWRSRDILMGMPANMCAMNTLHNYMVGELRSRGVSAQVGSYTDISIVPHIYFKRDANYLKAMENKY
jgi:thymidylate synthase